MKTFQEVSLALAKKKIDFHAHFQSSGTSNERRLRGVITITDRRLSSVNLAALAAFGFSSQPQDNLDEDSPPKFSLVTEVKA